MCWPGSIIFSPNSKRISYAAKIRKFFGEKVFAVVDGKEEKQYDNVSSHPIFSQNSQRIAYRAELKKKIFVVVDGKAGKSYDGTGEPIFSPDSQHVIYGAKEGNRYIVVKDEKEGNPFDGIVSTGKESEIVVSADHFNYLGLRDNEIYSVEESF